jgi:mRNA-degrading endonuclease RelE of RelBE toxin-antitoxin system
MAYKFVFRGESLKEFEHLTQGQRKAIAEKIKALENNPFGEGKTLENYAPLRRVKAGDARMIYDPEPDAKGRLSILAFGTDHSIYELDELLKEYLSGKGQRPD